ncbi:MAG: hypothetical protein IJS15_13935, partial [Victivallales bacterium]|nr:hypothetical protein [Victivallales bacterium]
GLFYFPSMKVTPCYYSFKAFNVLYSLGINVPSVSDVKDLFVCAAKDAGGNKAVLLANYTDEAQNVDLSFTGAAHSDFNVYRIDAEHSSLDKCGALAASSVSMPHKSVCLLANNAIAQGTASENNVKFAGLG